MPIVALTPTLVKKVVCPPNVKKYDLFDSKCKGLMLEVRKTGGKTYYLRFQDQRKKSHQFKLADEKDVTLSQAKMLADKNRALIVIGQDPFTKEKELKSIPTIADFVANGYLPHVKTYKRSWSTDEGLIRNHILPNFGKLYLDQFTKQHMISFISKHLETHKPGSVNRVIILMRYIFNCAIRWEVPGIIKNPTAGIKLLEENNKMERYLDFLGNVSYENFIPLLQLSTVHVYLTYPFVLSWSLLEAMSVGCSIVASDTSPLKEAIKHNETGKLVDFFNPKALTKEICNLLDDPGLRDKLGHQARVFAMEHYDLKSTCLPQQLAWVNSLVKQ